MVDVLLVEPDTVLARTYKTALQRAGLKVAVQQDAQGAIHSVDQQQPGIIILEIQLGEHNGVEFLYELRSHTDWQRMPVIIQTAISEQELGLSEQVINQLGIEAILYKPQTSLEKLVNFTIKTKNSERS